MGRDEDISVRPDRAPDGDKAEDEGRRPGYWTLLRAVPVVVAKAGLRGLTHRALAKEAGVTRGLVSYYFGNRDALIEGAARVASQEAIKRADLMPQSGDIGDFGAGLSRLVADEPDAQLFQYELACEGRRSEELSKLVQSMYDRYVAVISASLDQLGIRRDDAISRVVFAALDGIALQHLVYDDERMTDASIEALQEIMVELKRQSGH